MVGSCVGVGFLSDQDCLFRPQGQFSSSMGFSTLLRDWRDLSLRINSRPTLGSNSEALVHDVIRFHCKVSMSRLLGSSIFNLRSVCHTFVFPLILIFFMKTDCVFLYCGRGRVILSIWSLGELSSGTMLQNFETVFGHLLCGKKQGAERKKDVIRNACNK